VAIVLLTESTRGHPAVRLVCEAGDQTRSFIRRRLQSPSQWYLCFRASRLLCQDEHIAEASHALNQRTRAPEKWTIEELMKKTRSEEDSALSPKDELVRLRKEVAAIARGKMGVLTSQTWMPERCPGTVVLKAEFA